MNKKTTIKNSGFTLIELMIVVGILGVLATVALVAYRRYVDRAHAAEATSVLSDIRIKQEAYRATFRQYATDGTWRPDDKPGNIGRLWSRNDNWDQLGVRPDNDLFYSYYILAGIPSDAADLGIFAGTGINTSSDFWFAARAAEDLNSDGTCGGFEIYHGKASIVELDTVACP